MDVGELPPEQSCLADDRSYRRLKRTNRILKAVMVFVFALLVFSIGVSVGEHGGRQRATADCDLIPPFSSYAPRHSRP